jgi:hypothetical protein
VETERNRRRDRGFARVDEWLWHEMGFHRVRVGGEVGKERRGEVWWPSCPTSNQAKSRDRSPECASRRSATASAPCSLDYVRAVAHTYVRTYVRTCIYI